MRSLARLLPLGLVAVVLSVPVTSPSAHAATVTVRINSYAFQPLLLLVVQGTTVKWRNEDRDIHNVVSLQGFWTSPDLDFGGTYSRTTVFLSAGSYHYKCTHHPGDSEQPGEIGVVRVRLKAPNKASGRFTLRWSSRSFTPSNRSFDVEKKAPGSSTWVALKTDTTARSMSLNPRAGTWSYRARTDRVLAGVSSGWSPVKRVTVS